MTDKVIIVTGGTEGLGKSISKLLNAQYIVIAVSNNKQKIQQAKEDKICREAYYCDIADPENIEDIIKNILAKYSKIDVLINNAGVWVAGDLEENSYQDIAKVIMVNTVGTINMTKAVIPSMKKLKQGKIINICSVDAFETKEKRSIYAASKFGIRGFTENIRRDLKTFGVQVIGLYPGLIKTNLFENAGKNRDLSEAMESEEAAEVVKFCVDNDNVVLEQVIFRSPEEKL